MRCSFSVCSTVMMMMMMMMMMIDFFWGGGKAKLHVLGLRAQRFYKVLLEIFSLV